MAEILPFRALHYDPARVALGDVVTQPYDKISAEMQARYYAASLYNVARVIRRRPEHNGTDNVYAAAAHDFRAWVRDRVLVPDSGPALYPYDQAYTLPGGDSARRTRRGFIALLKLEDYSAGVVYRHEETLSGPKADRLELLRATRAHFGQIFMLYSDPEGTVERELAAAALGDPWERLEDEYGTQHAVRRVADGAVVDRVVAAMREKKLIIADGHHRYETALAYRDFCRAQAQADGKLGGKLDDPAEYVMATFVRMETDGLAILPTHRVVHHLTSFDWERFLAAARPHFERLQPAADAGGSTLDVRGLQASLANIGHDRPAFAVYAGPVKLALLRLRANADLGRLLPDLPPSLARLDVVVLHRILLERILGIDGQAVREERNLRYLRDADEAIREVERGEAQVCFLMNPTPIGAVGDNAFADRVLPQKSTDFYPKLLSGLAIYWLDQPVGR